MTKRRSLESGRAVARWLSTGMLGVCGALVLACGAQEASAPGDAQPAAPAEAARAPEQPMASDEDVAAMTQIEDRGFVYQDLAVATESARAGQGQQVTMKGRPLVLQGQEIRVGDKLPDVALTAMGMESVSMIDGLGHVRIISIVPALGTPVCEQQTHYLSEKNDGLEEQIELITVSLDTPDDQTQFATEARIENVTFLSDHPDAAFGSASGLLIEDPRLLARAVMVVDAENVVRYLQVVPEITQLPDMDAAFAFARSLL